jgi:hypothetical protein
MTVFFPGPLSGHVGLSGDITLRKFVPANSLSDFAYWHTKRSQITAGNDRPDPIMTLVTQSDEYTNTTWVRPAVAATAPREYYKTFDPVNPDSSVLLWPRAKFAAVKAIWDAVPNNEAHLLTDVQFEQSQGSLRNLLSFEAATMEGRVFPYVEWVGGGTATLDVNGYPGVDQSTDRAFSGTHSCKVLGASDGANYSPITTPFLGMGDVAGMDGEYITGQAMISASTSGRQYELNVRFYDANGAALGTVTSSTMTSNGTDTWIPVTMIALVPAGAIWASVVGVGLAQKYKSATAASWSYDSTSGKNTVTTTAAHNFDAGQEVIVNTSEADINGTFVITDVTSTTFSYRVSPAPVSSGTCTGTAQAYDVFYVDDTRLLAPQASYGPRAYQSPRSFNIKVRPQSINRVRNPSIEDATIGTRGYAAFGPGTPAVSRDTTVAKSGAASLHVHVPYNAGATTDTYGVRTTTSADGVNNSLVTGLKPSTTYTFSTWLKQGPGCPNVRTLFGVGEDRFSGLTAADIRAMHSNNPMYVDGDWTRLFYTFTTSDSELTGECFLKAYIANDDQQSGVNSDFWIDMTMVIEGNLPGDYFDGGTSIDTMWTGTPSWSRSHYYPGLRERSTVLTELVTNALPRDAAFTVTFGVDEDQYIPSVGTPAAPGAPGPRYLGRDSPYPERLIAALSSY